jgi:predicted GNAT superfamily acetyltransferase
MRSGDVSEVLALNKEWEHFMSSLTEESLVALCDEADYCMVATADEQVVAFLIALRENRAYASPNYQWFEKYYEQSGEQQSEKNARLLDSREQFLYIDRLVVDKRYQGRGIGQAFYEDAFCFAKSQGIERIVCEIDTEPPNEASQRFHDRLGFIEVGRQWLNGDTKQVSLREKRLP